MCLTGLILLITILCIVRLVIHFRTLKSFPLAIHYIILIEAIALLAYFSAYGYFWLHTIYEALQLITFVLVVFFFSLSARSLGLLHKSLTRGAITFIFILILLYIIASVAVIFYYQDNCTNVGRLMLASGELLFTIIFAYICFTMIRTISNSVKSIKKAVSKSFMLRHVKPLTSILLIYCWTSVINLALQVYLNISAQTRSEDCHREIEANIIIEYSYPIFKQIDELLPLVTILWYFFVTTRKDFKKKSPQVLPDVNTYQQIVTTTSTTISYPSFPISTTTMSSVTPSGSTIGRSLHMKGYDTGLASSIGSEE